MKSEKAIHELKLINSKNLIIPKEYQRQLKPARVAKIIASFSEYIANEPKVSFRDGLYYVFDGQHTIAARKGMNNGADLPILCKVYRGMNEREEAMLFSYQTGASAPLTPSAKLRAQLYGKDPDALAFQSVTEKAGFHLGFDRAPGDRRILCINTVLGQYHIVGAKSYEAALRIVLAAWDGKSNSLQAGTLRGVIGFVDLYFNEYDRVWLIDRLRSVNPVSIARNGRADSTLRGTKKYLYQVYCIYNHGLCGTQALPVKF